MTGIQLQRVWLSFESLRCAQPQDEELNVSPSVFACLHAKAGHIPGTRRTATGSQFRHRVFRIEAGLNTSSQFHPLIEVLS